MQDEALMTERINKEVCLLMLRYSELILWERYVYSSCKWPQHEDDRNLSSYRLLKEINKIETDLALDKFEAQHFYNFLH